LQLHPPSKGTLGIQDVVPTACSQVVEQLVKTFLVMAMAGYFVNVGLEYACALADCRNGTRRDFKPVGFGCSVQIQEKRLVRMHPKKAL